jgi:hypothetical protein
MIAVGSKGESAHLTDGLTGVIAQLERQRSAIDRALEALREVEGIAAPAAAKSTAVKAPLKAAVDRRSEGQRKRWALKKAAESAPAEEPQPVSKSRVTPEGRQKLADAMKKRWAAKRAATPVTKAARRKRSTTKAV